jgi:hypothetical protein
MSPNSKFANIWNIKATQLQAQLELDNAAGIAVPENPPNQVAAEAVDSMGRENED